MSNPCPHQTLNPHPRPNRRPDPDPDPDPDRNRNPNPNPNPNPDPNQAVAKSVGELGPRLSVALAPLLHRALSPEPGAPAWPGISSAQDGELGQGRNLGCELTPLEVQAEATRRR